ncbi:MAG: hypothetical protein WDN24_04240 [Sphingomonas sp.]
MKASVAGPPDALVRPSSVPLDLFVGYLSGGGASNLPVELRIGYFDGIATPAGYASYSFGGRAMTEGTRPMSGDGDDEEVPLPPTQTLPVTLGGDGSARASVDVPATLDLGARHVGRDGLSGRQRRSADGVAAHPALSFGGAARPQDRRLADEAGRHAPALRDARHRGQAGGGAGDLGRALQPRDPHGAAAADRRLLCL